MSRTRLAPTPTNISTKSEPEMEKKGTPASPAIARAKRVLPVPGEPTSSAPFGIWPPSLAKRPGFFRNSTISSSSSRASSIPATSWNVTLPCFSVSSFALDLPKPIAPEPLPFCICRSTKKAMPRISRKGRDWTRMICQMLACSWALPLYSTPFSSSSVTSDGSLPTGVVVNRSPLVISPVILSGAMETLFTLPSSTLLRNEE